MKFKFLFIYLITLFTSNIYAGGGWTNEKGTAYIKVSGWWVESKNFFSGNGGESRSTVESGLLNVNIYAEYGLTDKLTAIGYIPFFTRSYQNREVNQNGDVNTELPGGSLNTFGDSEIGLKYNIYKNDRFSISTSLTLGIPFGNDGENQEVSALATGDGEFNQIARVDIGASLFQNYLLSIYGNAYFGYNNRTKGFSDELRGGAEIGVGLIDKKLWFIGKLDIIESTRNGDTNSDGNNTSVFANNAEVVNLGLEASYYITKKIGVSSGFTYPLSGKSGFDSPSYSGGIFFDLK